MPAELTVFLGPLQSLLAWFQKHRGVKDEQKDIALPRCQGSCRLSEMELGVGWGRKLDY